MIICRPAWPSIGSRNTDAYLAALARQHRLKLTTFDRGFAVTHPDVATLVRTQA
jgi:predicted nucleic acid-binding protein